MRHNIYFGSHLIVPKISLFVPTCNYFVMMEAPRECKDSVDAWRYLNEKATTIKARERRQKIESDIRLIRDRKKNATIIPVPSDQQTAYFGKLESNEIWELVLQDLTSLADITSACFASDMFRDHLDERRILMLLPQVFGALRSSQYLRFVKSKQNEADANRIILNLRLVSQAWKEAAEEQFLSPTEFSNPDWYLLGPPLDLEGWKITSPFVCKFENTADVKKAMNVLSTSQSCTALLKVIDIEAGDNLREDAPILYSKTEEFFDLHGEHVLALHFSDTFDYKSLWTMATRTPNLKELSLRWYEWASVDETAWLAQHPFPTIPSLTRFSFLSFNNFEWMIPEIVQRNPSLRAVLIRDDDARFFREISQTLANLQLERLDFYFDVQENPEMCLTHFRSLLGMTWPLKVLNLNRFRSPHTVNACDLFGILKHFNDTLEEINLGAMTLRDDGRSVVVHFPYLKNISNVLVALAKVVAG